MRTAEKEQSNESVVDRWNRGAVTNRLKIEWNKGEEEEGEEEPSLCTGMHQQPPQLKAIDMMVQLKAISWKESSATNHRLNEWWWLASATTFRWERLPASDEKVVSLRCLCKKMKTYFEGRPRIASKSLSTDLCDPQVCVSVCDLSMSSPWPPPSPHHHFFFFFFFS